MRNSVMLGFIWCVHSVSCILTRIGLRIEAYLLWSELTIDDGLAAGARIPKSANCSWKGTLVSTIEVHALWSFWSFLDVGGWQ